METQTKKKNPIVGIIAAICGGIIGVTVVSHYFSHSPNVESTLVTTSTSLNKHLPMMVDTETRWDTTTTAPNKTLVYHYTLVNTKAADLQKDKFVNALRPGVLANYKTNGSMKTLRDEGVTMQYDYSDKDGVFVAEFAVSPKDF